MCRASKYVELIFSADQISVCFHYLHSMKVYVECDIFKLYIGFLVM